jgi:hypothetical protein
MPRLSTRELNEFLLKPNIAKVASLSSDGSPCVNPVWYLWDEDVIWFNGRKGFGGMTSKWVENIEGDSRVMVLIDTDDHPYTRVQMKGKAVEIDPPPKNWPELNMKMTIHYIGQREAERYVGSFPEVPGAWIRFTPEEILSWRGPEWHARYLKDGN